MQDPLQVRTGARPPWRGAAAGIALWGALAASLARPVLGASPAPAPSEPPAQASAPEPAPAAPPPPSPAAAAPASAPPAAPAAPPAADGAPPAEPRLRSVVLGRRRRSSASRTHLSARELSLRGARSLPDALADEASVGLNESPKAGTSLEIRGFDERSIQVLLEGIPLREVYDGHFDLGAVPLGEGASVDLERGVTPLGYGPNSAGGVLRLHVPDACARNGEVTLYGGNLHEGSLLLAGGRLALCGQRGDLSVRVQAEGERSAGRALPESYSPSPEDAAFHEDGGLRDGSESRRASLGLLAKLAPSPNRSLTFFTQALRAPRSVPPFESVGYLRTWRFDRYDSWMAGLAGVYGPARPALQWGLRQLRGQLYTHWHRDELADYESVESERLTSDPLAWFARSAYSNESYGASLQGTWALRRGNEVQATLRAGLDRHSQRELPVAPAGESVSWSPWERASAWLGAAALEDTQTLGPWRLGAGLGASGLSLAARELRETSYPVSDRVLPAWEGRLVLERSLGEHLRVLAATGRKVRFPTLKELFSNSVGGNPELDRETAWMSEIGLDSDGLGVRGLSTSTRLFWNSIDDLIQRSREAYGNVGEARTAGVEVEARWRAAPWLELQSAYRYLSTWNGETERPLDYRSPQRLRLSTRVFGPAGLTAGLGASAASAQESNYVDGTSGQWRREHLPGSLLLDGHLRWELDPAPWFQAAVFVHGRNLLDTTYVTGSFEPRAGRELQVGVSASL